MNLTILDVAQGPALGQQAVLNAFIEKNSKSGKTCLIWKTLVLIPAHPGPSRSGDFKKMLGMEDSQNLLDDCDHAVGPPTLGQVQGMGQTTVLTSPTVEIYYLNVHRHDLAAVTTIHPHLCRTTIHPQTSRKTTSPRKMKITQLAMRKRHHPNGLSTEKTQCQQQPSGGSTVLLRTSLGQAALSKTRMSPMPWSMPIVCQGRRNTHW